MQKTRLGISVGLLGAILCVSNLFMNYIVTIVLAGYILLLEDNVWLKRTTIKVLVLISAFEVASIGLELIPDAINLIGSVAGLFGGSFSLNFLTNFINLLKSIISFIRTVVFLSLGLKALTQGTVVIPIVDNFISKHMD